MRQQLRITTSKPRTRRAARLLVGVACALAIVAAPACGSDDGESAAPADDAVSTTAPGDDAESDYCDTAREWTVHELDGDGDDVSDDPAALEAYFAEYVEFAETSLSQSPAELQEQHELNVDAITTTLVPVLERYDYDVARIEAEGTPEEKAVSEPTPDVQAAQTAILAYEATVCGTGRPEPADVTFEADPSSEAYCEALVTSQERFDEVAAEFDPAEVETLLTEELDALSDPQAETVPDEIAEDWQAVDEWTRNQFVDVFEAYDYDIRAILLDGTQADREALHYLDPAIAEQVSRVDAYDAQVCGVE